ncbi:MAG TPA: hypothetical protein VJV79_29575, partial [Polyangiaceae bacterium]|nr:hypothetical protein [Polyangiaceae bacterium]
ALAEGFTTSNCMLAETPQLGNAMQFLIEEVSTNHSSLRSCMTSANLLECRGSTPTQIVDALRAARVTKFRCVDGGASYGSAGPNTWGACAESGDHTVVDIVSGTVRGSSTEGLAAMIAHESMHQKDYNHQVDN